MCDGTGGDVYICKGSAPALAAGVDDNERLRLEECVRLAGRESTGHRAQLTGRNKAENSRARGF